MTVYQLLELSLSILLIGFSVYIFTHHKKVWLDYKKKYKKSKRPIVNAMFRPNKVVYQLHIFFIAPLALLMGAVLLVKVITELL